MRHYKQMLMVDNLEVKCVNLASSMKKIDLKTLKSLLFLNKKNRLYVQNLNALLSQFLASTLKCHLAPLFLS